MYAFGDPSRPSFSNCENIDPWYYYCLSSFAINNAAERSTVLSFLASALDLDFLDEVERYVCVGIATDQARGLLTFDEIGILRIGSAADGYPNACPFVALPGIIPPLPLAVVLPISGSLRAEGAN